MAGVGALRSDYERKETDHSFFCGSNVGFYFEKYIYLAKHFCPFPPRLIWLQIDFDLHDTTPSIINNSYLIVVLSGDLASKDCLV